MDDSLKIPLTRMITVTEARRNFGKLIRETLSKGDFILIKGGKPVAKLVSLGKKIPGKDLTAWDKLKDSYGAWADSDLDNNKLWNDILVKGRKLGTKKKRIKL